MNWSFILLFPLVSGVLCGADSGKSTSNYSRTLSDPVVKWFTSYSLGWDGNPVPLSSTDSDSAYGRISVGTSYTKQTPYSMLNTGGNLANLHYFSTPRGAKANYSEVKAKLNFRRSLNERVEISTNNSVKRQSEPDYDSGIATVRESDQYVLWNTANAVRYRLSDLTNVSAGVDFSSLSYDQAQASDYTSGTLNLSYSYRQTPQTTLRLNYSYKVHNLDSNIGSDTNTHCLNGAWKYFHNEHSSFEANVGPAFRYLDKYDDYDVDIFFQGTYIYKPNQRISNRLWIRYRPEDNSLTLGDTAYEKHNLLRVGFSTAYKVSEKLNLRSSITYIDGVYKDKRSGPGLEKVDENLYHINLGFSYQYLPNFSISGNYNFSENSSDIAGRDYDRQRINLGVNFTY